MRVITTLRILACATGLSLSLSAYAQWTVVSLKPSGTVSSSAFAAEGGHQVGQAYLGGSNKASFWNGSAGSWVNLNPAGATESLASGLGSNQQVGSALIGGVWHAGAWIGTAASWVDLHPSGASSSFASARDSSQEIKAGSAVFAGKFHAGYWTSGPASFVDLNPAGASASQVHGANGGQQVGEATVGLTSRASLWSGSAASWIDLHPAIAQSSVARGVSGGQQAGMTNVGGFGHASLWTGTAESWVDLNPSGATNSECYGVSGGQQAGLANVGAGGARHAGMWTSTAASWVDLHSVLTGNFSFSEARGIWRDSVGTTYVVGFGLNTTTGLYEALMWRRFGPDYFTLSLNKASVAGQNSVLGTITMTEPKGTPTVFTTYDNSSLVTTPPTVTVMTGQLVRSFQIQVTAITSTVLTTIFAKRGPLTQSQSLTLTPLIPTAVVCTPNPVTGGQTTSCKVVINGVAGPGGRVISIFDDSPKATTPSTVTVPAGATNVTFPIATSSVTATTTVTVTARVSAGEKTGTLRISP